MLVEATLDFPEEEIDFLQKADATGQLARLQAQLAGVQQRAVQGALLREGIKVVIAGQPNAGKSSLLNALAGAELAIVSAVAGTTRDVVSQTIQIHGVPLHVADTAGLRESSDEVEQIGVARAWGQIESADAVLFLHDLTRADLPDYAAADAEILRGLRSKLPASVPVLDVWNKQDAAPRRPAGRRASPCPPRPAWASRRCASSCWPWPAGSRCPRACTSRGRATCRRWARSKPTWRWPRATLRRRPSCSTCWPRNCAWRRTR
jgi:tRNA modification GTPase